MRTQERIEKYGTLKMGACCNHALPNKRHRGEDLMHATSANATAGPITCKESRGGWTLDERRDECLVAERMFQ